MSDISDISCTPPEIREAAYKIYCQQNQENVRRSFMKNLYSAVKTKI
jgi:L-ribulose-5-phosphate 3-epimerase UlaE